MSRRRKHKPGDFRIKRRTEPGTSPGTITADPTQRKPEVSVIAYSGDKVLQQTLTDLGKIPQLLADYSVTWINVEGLGDAKLIEQFGELFGLHRLAMEDVVNLHQRAKVEEYDEILFIVLRMINCDQRAGTEQLSIFVGPHFVLTFQEGAPGDPFGGVRQRLKDNAGRIRKSGSDYLAYALIDAVVDSYYPVLEVYAEKLDVLEDSVLDRPTRQTMDELHQVKADLLLIRRAIWPQREAIANLMRETTPQITAATRVYLRDCYDHVVQIVELLETYRELTADLRDLYMSSISNRINETMRVLTIMSTLFIPLTFIAGVYGMNFDTSSSPWNMPELKWYYGYPLCLLLMGVTGVGMMVYFYRQGWIFRSFQREEPVKS
ncbi:MAG: magnesium/cobalt transporter CorA [Pirellulaceae bacterium]